MHEPERGVVREASCPEPGGGIEGLKELSGMAVVPRVLEADW